MATTHELQDYFSRMAKGEFQPGEINVIKGKNSSSTGLGRSKYSKAMYKISNMVGGGPVTVSPVQQSIEQARQMSRLKRGRSASRSQSRPRKRRKKSTSSGKRKGTRRR